MARFNYETVHNYGSSGTNLFFKLENDKDVARVRFLYNGIEDVEGVSVHEVEIDGKHKYVECLREYNQPIDECPLCAANYKIKAKVFVKLYDVDMDKSMLWDRGKPFMQKLSGLAERYNPLVSHEFEIERHGVKGDMKTTYEIFPVGEKDDTTVEDLPPADELMGTILLQKSYDDMEYYLENDEFPEEGEEAQRSGGRSAQRRSGGSSRNEERPQRRGGTSANRTRARRGSEDTY